jgi:hypothetical protein
MPTLKIDFQEGFRGQLGIVRLDGKESFRKELSTRTQIGLAHSQTLEVSVGRHELEIEIEVGSGNGPQVARTTLEVSDVTYVGVSLDAAGKPVLRLNEGPFGYL